MIVACFQGVAIGPDLFWKNILPFPISRFLFFSDQQVIDRYIDPLKID